MNKQPKTRPLRKVEIGSRSRKAKFLTIGIFCIFRGTIIEPDKKIGPKADFCRSLKTGFTLVEVIVSLLILSFLVVVAGLGVVQIAQGYVTSNNNLVAAQKAQAVMTRLILEFEAISALSPSGNSGAGISYSRLGDEGSGIASGTYSVNFSSGTITLTTPSNTHTLARDVNSFSLNYYNWNSGGWLEITAPDTNVDLIEISLGLPAGLGDFTKTFTTRVAPQY